MDWFFETIRRLMAEAAGQAIGMLLSWSVDMTSATLYWHDAWAQRAAAVVRAVAWSVLTLRVVYEAYRLYILRDTSDSFLSPGVLLRRTLIAVFWVAAAGPIVDWMHTFARAASAAVLGGGIDTSDWQLYSNHFERSLLQNMGWGAFFLFLFIYAVFACGLLLVKLQAAARGVELAVAYVVGPVMALSAIANDDYLASGTLAVWWREVLVCSLTQVVQSLLILALAHYVLAGGFDILRILMALPVLWVAVKSPTILRQYAYHSGVGKATNSAGMIAIQFLARAAF
ncbi:conjugal transfer protein TrbL family protein [Symbiobacterium terraclitae]|uniref:conjugal transfer protein TrbL family protein n=1 Tax=Symbiobacterium terraclitae TaxID=557451 RepID=UPI0035B53783